MGDNCEMVMQKTKFVLCLWLSLCLNSMADQIEWEMAFEQALYQETVLGDIATAMMSYEELSRQSLPRELQAKVQMRMAFCYEKMGQLEKSEGLYNHIAEEYGDITAIHQMVTAQIREYVRRKQIKQLQKQLENLKEIPPTLQEQMEKEIKKLHEKILSLQRHQPEETSPLKPEASNRNEEEAKKAKQREVSEALSSHLSKLAQDLYQKGHLELAKENLKNAISLNPGAEEAKELLKKVEAMLAHRNAPHIVRESSKPLPPSERIDKFHEGTPDIFEMPQENLVEKSYDAAPLIRQWKLEDGERPGTWEQNVAQMFAQQAVHANVVYKDGQFVVRASPAAQDRLDQFWNNLLQARDVVRISGHLFPSPSSGQKFYWESLGGVFYESTCGLFYAQLTEGQKKQLQSALTEPPIFELSEKVLLANEKTVWEYLQEIPLAKGYYGNSLNFQFYSQGFRLLCKSDPKNFVVDMEISTQKLSSPIDVIPTANGPVELPYLTEQKAVIQMVIDAPKDLLVCGILNPDERRMNSTKMLILLMRVESVSLGKYLAGAVQQSNQPTSDSEKFLRSYNIQQWRSPLIAKFDQEKFAENDPTSFLPEFLRRELDGKSFPGHSLEIVQDHLVVYGSPDLHNKVEEILHSLREESRALCQISVYLVSLERYTLHQLLQGWQIKPAQGEKLHSYAIPEEKLMKKLESLEGLKFHYSLGPVIVGNLQLASLKDCHILSFMENLNTGKSPVPRSAIADIPEGLFIKARPFIMSETSGIIDLKASLYRRKQLREVVTALNSEKNISWKIPEVDVEHVQIRFSFEQGQTIILSGLFYEAGNPTRDFILLVTPSIFPTETAPGDE